MRRFTARGSFLLPLAFLCLGLPAGISQAGKAPLSLFAAGGPKESAASMDAVSEKDKDPSVLRSRKADFAPLMAAADQIAGEQALVLNLFDDAAFTASVDRVTSDLQGVVSVRGRLNGFPYGHALLSTCQGRTLGLIEVPEKGLKYSIQYDPATKTHVIREHDPARMDVLEGGPALVPDPPKKGAAAARPAADAALAADTPVTVDVMIVYTPAARLWANTSGGGIAQVIAQAMEKAQLAHDNSGTQMTLRLVHAAEVSYTETSDAGNDLDRLTNPGDGHMDQVHTWRDTYGADFVALFMVRDDYGGLGWLLDNPAGEPGNAFCLNRIQQMSSSYTLVHEMGHNMGAHHRRDQDVQPGPGLFSYSAGWRWTGTDNRKYCSVMSYEEDNHVRIGYFSSPLTTYQGRATGTATDDNARTIREVRQAVSGYRSTGTSAPANDHFSSAATVSGAKSQAAGKNLGATRETGEPQHAGTAGGKSVWWKWTAPSAGTVVVDTLGSSLDTLLGVYTGSAVGSLTEVASNNNYGGGVQSRVSFTAAAGTVYRIAVDGSGGATGDIVLNVELSGEGPVNDHFYNATTVAAAGGLVGGKNVGATNQTGEPSHAGNTGGKSVWWKWTPTVTGAVTMDTFGSGFDTLLAVYTGDAVGGLTAVRSNDDAGGGRQSQVSFYATAGIAYRIAVDGYGGASGDILLRVTPSGSGPANNPFAGAVTVTSSGAQMPGSNVGADKETGEPAHAGFNGGKSVWWKWTAPSAGPVILNTYGSSFDTLLAVYTGTSVGGLTAVASNDDAGDGPQSQVNFTAVAGTTYRIAVDGYGGASGNILLTLTHSGGGPANNAFVNAIALPAQGGSATGTNVGATKETGEPSHAGNAGGRSVWWKWTAPWNGTVTLDTVGSAFDTLLGVYTGGAVGGLTAVAANDDAAGGRQSRVVFNAVAGATYRIAVDGYSAATGSIKVNLSVLGVPGISRLTYPAGGEIVDNRRPQFTWASTTPPATWYYIYINRNGQKYLAQWVENLTGWTPPGDLPAGFYEWWVMGWNPAGEGAWSSRAWFTIQSRIPAIITLLGPSGTQEGATFNYRWRKDANATWYQLYVQQNGVPWKDLWYQDSGTGEKSVALSGHGYGSAYRWWVRGWGPDGYGPWSGYLQFNTPSGDPGKPVLMSPSGQVAVRKPQFSWAASTRASWYRIYVQNMSAGYTAIDGWLQGTSAVPSNNLNLGQYRWWVASWNEATKREIWSNPLDFSIAANGFLYNVTLTWGAEPRDLDAHMKVPGGYHVYYNSKGDLSAAPYTRLDTDEKYGNGPENIAIYDDYAGTYRYYVKRYAGTGTLAGCGARVTLRNAAGQSLLDRTVPTTGTGDYWHVFDLNAQTGAITTYNVIQVGEP